MSLARKLRNKQKKSRAQQAPWFGEENRPGVVPGDHGDPGTGSSKVPYHKPRDITKGKHAIENWTSFVGLPMSLIFLVRI